MQQSYEFGRNWRTFIDGHLDDERIAEAVRSLQAFVGLHSLDGKTFLDIGCGSGLFSLAAHRMGAARIVSLDVDPDSVACTRELHAREGAPASWEVLHGSVLDESFMASLGEFDVVYSWGVLHHTGSMWVAIENAARAVRRGGLLYIAIYNRADGIGLHSDGRVGSSRVWEAEKRFYNRLPEWGKRVMDYSAAAGMVGAYLVAGRNPIREIRSHKSMRGMSWMVDIRDWLGGYPYEYASVSEVFHFMKEKTGFSLESLRSTNSLRCNEYLFRRVDGATTRDG
ncbi:MAG TPA: class I SAM-dependent methyltransferase [Polyangiaceae bacterium]|nr:class I SAM-dependent methyltransferase [Polyangiaceae bacterium]